MGFIHWMGFDRPTQVRGLYRFLRLVALATNRTWRFEPEWLQLYHTHVWASKMLTEKFHRRARVEWSAKDRARSWRLLHRGGSFGSTWLSYRDWIANGLRVLREEGKPVYLRRPVTKEEVDSWVEARCNGTTYQEIALGGDRSPKVVWFHLRARGLTG
jgi:hypothetical protein